MLQKGGFAMRGTVVIARGYGDAALVRRVWEVAGGLVYLSDEVEFAKLEAGKEGLPPIGFPANDVYVYDAKIAPQKGSVNWEQLQQWRPMQAV